MSTATLTPAETAQPAKPRSYALRDSMTMLRRNLKRLQRYPSLTITIVVMRSRQTCVAARRSRPSPG